MTGIVEFLTARLDEDEEAAIVAARDAAYQTGNEAPDWSVRAPLALWSAPLGRAFGEVSPTAIRAAVHIARHDPARVLAEVKAKWALMALHQAEQVEYLDGDGQDRMSTDCTTCDTCGCADTWPCLTLKLLAAPYDQHPDYKQAWRADA